MVTPPLGEQIPPSDRFSHILISGGKPSVLDKSGWVESEMDLIRSAVSENKNLLGICYGHQLIAATIFGLHTIRRRKNPELGWTEIRVLNDDNLCGKRDQIYWGYVSHNDDVIEVCEDTADIIMASQDCAIHGFKLKGKNIWGLQAHFEISVAEGLRLNELEILKNPNIAPLILNRKHPKDSGFIDLLMDRFQML
jgi:GMP synthase (glutamine-hydrolysing)